MSRRPQVDQRAARMQTSVKMPVVLKNQLNEFADQIGVPINSAMILLLDRGLRAAGYPGVSGPTAGTVVPKPPSPTM